ncbi:MAG: cupin-like domain-containing protein, partial [Cyanobacteria bacterium]|nr:cupin-like domain-containing protein [Cyanobacteriota bacterium]
YNRESRFSDVVFPPAGTEGRNQPVDLEKYPLFQNAQVIEFILEPGQCVFMPVGWWHEITALDVSISLTMTQFKYNNTYDWMIPTHQ